MKVRITVEREFIGWTGHVWAKPPLIKQFDDVQRAANWMIEDSYFTNPDVKRVTWEVIDDVT